MATSPDGQQISYWRSGEGPPVVLVHGALSDRSAWILVHPILARRFAVFSVNRRGRDGSGAPAPHTMEQEFADIVAVVEAVGDRVHLVGHSGGALCSLGAALLTDRLDSLTLYEPPWVEELKLMDLSPLLDLIRDGRNEEAALLFLRIGPQVPEADLQRLVASPIWPHIVSLAPTMPAEFGALAGYQFDALRYRDTQTPMLLLVGEDSPPVLKAVNQALRDVAPDARYVDLPGQQHGANLDAPEMLAAEITKFIDEVEAR
jgi:pimeloyl-ACP methyl ester carboxylesterase